MKKQLFYQTLTLLLLMGLHTSKAQLSGYSNKIQVTVNNTSSQTAINTQIKLLFNTQSLITQNKMQAGGNDIRFAKTCNGGHLYNYWIESGINTASTVIWVKLDTLPANASRKIYLFSGNSSAQAFSSIPLTFDYAGSSTDSVASGVAGGVSNCQRGFRFSPKVDILVTKLGKMEPDGNTRYITLFDQASQTIITQQQVGGPADVYTYASLPNPIWLTEGTQYSIQMYQGANDGYYFGTSSQVDSRLNFFDMRYCNNCTQNTFPTDSLSNYQYGYPDLEFYYTNKVSPEPGYILDTVILSPLIISGPASICKGETITLVASGSAGYLWNTNAVTPSISASPSITTSYTVRGFSPGGCTSYAVKTISVNSLPVLLVQTSNTVLCIGETAILSVSGAAGYLWNTGSTSESIEVSPTTATSYSVRGIDENGCSWVESLVQNVSDCTGIQMLSDNKTGIHVYPNPSNGMFYLKATSQVNLTLMNELGQIVNRIELNAANDYSSQVKVEDPGFYFVCGSSSGKLFSQKICVTR